MIGVLTLEMDFERHAGRRPNLGRREVETLCRDLDDLNVSRRYARRVPGHARHQNHHPNPMLNEFAAASTALRLRATM